MDADIGVSMSGAQTDHEARAEDISATTLLETCPVGSSTAEEYVDQILPGKIYYLFLDHECCGGFNQP